MLPDDQLEAALIYFQEQVDELTAYYLRLVGEHIKSIGSLSSSDIQRVEQLRRLDTNMRKIENELARLTDRTAAEVRDLLRTAAESTYKDAGYLYKQANFSKNPAVVRLFQVYAAQTLGAMVNYSQTRIASDAYRAAVDTAIKTVQTGVESYNSAMTSGLRKVAVDGVQVFDAGGTRKVLLGGGGLRRLDTAFRQNLLDGVRQLNQAIAAQVGREFGADGVEISAHLDCAEDHLPYQGKQFSKAQFDFIQGELGRPIGGYNCKHIAYPILLGFSDPAYTEAQLAEINKQSSEKVTIDGVEKSRYHWTQEQRRLETAVRYQKDAAIVAAAAGNDPMRREAQSQINALVKRYNGISKAADIPARPARMKVAGFRPVKTLAAQP